MIYTGGTIGMVHDNESDTFIPFDFENLQAQIPELKQLDAQLHVHSFEPSIDSSNMHPSVWQELSETIASSYGEYDGFVILHGSDTMAYTASALSFMLEDLNKPVVLTGSQLPSGVPRTDAKENLITAIEIASSQTNGLPTVPEVCVYFEYQLYRGNRTRKVNAENFQAFASVNYPPLAEAGVHLKFNRSAIKKAHQQALKVHSKINTNIGVLKLFPGITESVVKNSLNHPDTEAVILETFGSGNAPTAPWFLAALAEAVARGVIILNVTQCAGGSVELGRYETSKSLKGLGVISAQDMTFEAALTKLMFVLAQTEEHEKRIELITRNLRGEMTDA